jgi:hypothetical protein
VSLLVAGGVTDPEGRRHARIENIDIYDRNNGLKGCSAGPPVATQLWAGETEMIIPFPGEKSTQKW